MTKAPSIKEALKAISEFPVTDPKNMDAVNMREVAKSALATLSPPAGERREAIAVKPLEWDRENATAHVPETWRAESIGRKYDIQRTGDGKFDLWADTGTAMTVEDTLEAAKTAAQTDYENRVRSVILASGLVQDEAAALPEVPANPLKAFAYLVSRCAEGLGAELIKEGKTDTQSRNQIIHHFLDFAAGEACRVAHGEDREPDPDKWVKATRDAFARAVKRTAISSARDGGDS